MKYEIMNTTVNDVLKQTNLFAQLSDAELAVIAPDLVERRYGEGEIIFHEGDPGQMLYIVGSGQVRIFVNGLDGSETSVIVFGRPGELFGELAVIDGLPRSATAVSLDQTTLYTINREQFRDHMRRSPQLALNFMQELSQRVRYNTRQMDSLVTLPVPARLARKLVELAQAYGRPTMPDNPTQGVHIDLALTQSQLASLIGASRESTNKSLRDFQRQQWIRLAQGHIIVLDPDGLRGQVRVTA
jgi:CRP/FNR family transcriptional regulator, cyclic AMP receptor protein